eukprot:m.123861 g.123861  ORF g.123861 m.123861 type:complete len:259 (-) comp16267_c0_seq3:162-938(-)
MTRFRPCIDLHHGVVKQIVGATLTHDDSAAPRVHFVADKPASAFAAMYRANELEGAHMIMLGPGNEQAAKEALQAWPGGLQVGGGITRDNALEWIQSGAAKVIVTSYLFEGSQFSRQRAQEMSALVGRDRLVIDLSCKRRADAEGWFVATNKWQTVTDLRLSKETLHELAAYASEFLIHAADVEGLCKGIDEDLVRALGEWSPIPCCYAGGGKALSDLDLVKELSGGRVDLTFGSALDIFGGSLVRYADCVAWNQRQA